MTENNTIFGKILNGEIPSDRVWEDEHCIAFRDINPSAPTHVLVIPREHIPTANDISSSQKELIGHLVWVAGQVAAQEGSGYMATILRVPGPSYRVSYDKVRLQSVANSERSFPEAWISPSRTDVTDDFLRYARPLIGDDWPNVPVVDGLQRFARLAPVMADKKLPGDVPEAHRETKSPSG